MDQVISKKSDLKINPFVIFGLFFSLCILLRLPHLVSDASFLDGDEGVVGIMAQRLLEGKVSVYFLGQNYGFAFLESLSVALFLKIFGAGLWALRLGGLLLFSIGGTMVLKTFDNKGVSRKKLWFVALLLASFPVWYLWGMYVRGGYVTAFLCVSILFYISQIKPLTYKWACIAGVIAGLSYESQSLVLLGFLPVLTPWFFFGKKLFKQHLVFLGSLLLMIIICRFFYTENPVWFKPELNLGVQTQLDQLKYHLGDLTCSFSNYHFFSVAFKNPIWLVSLIVSALISFVVLLNSLIIKGWSDSKKTVFIFLAMIALYLFVVSGMRLPAPRYWIGLLTGAMFLTLHLLIRKPLIQKYWGVVLLFLSMSIVGGNHRRDWYKTDLNEMSLMTELYNTCKKDDVKYVYTVEPDFQWKWNYLFGEMIPASSVLEAERTQDYINRISALKRQGGNNAVIGFKGIYNGLNVNAAFYVGMKEVGNKYFIHLNPTTEELKGLKEFSK